MNNNNNKENSLVILITGTSRGVGNYLANYYLNKGFIVIGCSRGDCNIQNPKYFHFLGDISQQDFVMKIFQFIRKDYKRLDILINNAVINPVNLPISLLSYETIESVVKVNMLAPILFCREATKIMGRNKFGRIINIGSMLTKHEIEGAALYTSTKTAINSFTRILAKEIYNNGITANVISISAIESDLSKNVNPEILNGVLKRNAVKKYGELEDVSNTIDFLISSSSKTITGQVIYLGGA